MITYRNLPKCPGPSTTIPEETQNDGRDHLVEPVANGMRRNARAFCQFKGCTQCKKCKVGLCVTCFVSYHTMCT